MHKRKGLFTLNSPFAGLFFSFFVMYDLFRLAPWENGVLEIRLYFFGEFKNKNQFGYAEDNAYDAKDMIGFKYAEYIRVVSCEFTEEAGSTVQNNEYREKCPLFSLLSVNHKEYKYAECQADFN